MDNSTILRQEYERGKRRRRRQWLGLAVGLVLLIGVISIVKSTANGVAKLFDDTKKRQAYEQRLTAFVMLDPLPFESVDKADQMQILESAIWSAIFKAQRSEAGLSLYERDPETEALILPEVEVSAALTELFGQGYTVQHKTFESSGMVFMYNAEKKGYLIPVTGQNGRYSATVVKLQKRDGKQIVTVGYLPAAGLDEFTLVNPTEPTKYMEYVFEKSGKEYYLVALQASEMKPQTGENPLEHEDVDNTFDMAGQLAENAGLMDDSQPSTSDPQADEPTSTSTAQ